MLLKSFSEKSEIIVRDDSMEDISNFGFFMSCVQPYLFDRMSSGIFGRITKMGRSLPFPETIGN